MSADVLLNDMLMWARAVIAESLDTSALNLADKVNELNEWLRTGCALPNEWRPSVADEISHLQYEQALYLAWMLSQQPDEQLRIPYEELVNINAGVIHRQDDKEHGEIIFTFRPHPKPDLQIVKESS